jgi:hypothetical protein
MVHAARLDPVPRMDKRPAEKHDLLGMTLMRRKEGRITSERDPEGWRISDKADLDPGRVLSHHPPKGCKAFANAARHAKKHQSAIGLNFGLSDIVEFNSFGNLHGIWRVMRHKF